MSGEERGDSAPQGPPRPLDLLADLPPLSIPGDVVARIDAALAREARTWSQAIPTNRSAPEPAPEDAAAQAADFAAAQRRRRRR